MSNSNGIRLAASARGAMPPLEQVFRKRRILLTGSTGFLGKIFLLQLLRWHPEIGRIHLLIRGDRRSSHNRFRREILDSPVMSPLREHLGSRFDHYVEDRIAIVPGDITVTGLLNGGAEPLKRGALDAVVHCAGLVNFEASLEKSISINTTAVKNVIEFCRAHGASLLHVSTCYVAGSADGHRYEDDIPENWCPSGKKNFNTEREIRDALAAVARVDAESREQLRHAEIREELNEAGADDGREHVVEQRRKQWVEERLKDVGRERARSWGWPNTYSYTKSLGEQLVLAERNRLNVTVARPAVIEGSLHDPFPGWNQGVNTSAPLTYMAGRGYRFYPAKADLVLDVIPVDLAAHAMVPILAALLFRRQKPIYQLCTSDRNPLPMHRLVELTGLSNRLEHRHTNGSMRQLSRHLEAVIVSQGTYDFASSTLPRVLRRAADAAKTLLGEKSARLKRIEDQIDTFTENTDLARSLVEVYRPYIQQLAYTFHGQNVRSLYASLRPADVARHRYEPYAIDWYDYWLKVNVPGLRKHIFPQLELHTRGRARPLPRFRTLPDMLDRAAQRYGAAAALVAQKQSGERTTISYRDLRDRVRRAALALLKRGVKHGDRVLLI
ncbi:MAG: SDR family oxidoreductase, partial [Candidatus Binataceae bacterium]